VDAQAALDDAAAEAERIVERAHRRSAETEAGATTLREQVADEVIRLRAEGAQTLRDARDESVRLMAEAQEQADQLRAQARQVLADAKTQATSLRSRRDEIAAELTQLSGVIDALSVPEHNLERHPDEEQS
jgi:uncharacterized protein involved in exopolysaccharide biosynthesis